MTQTRRQRPKTAEPKAGTKADIQRSLEMANETNLALQRQIQELHAQLGEGVEASPVYRQALEDAAAARSDAQEWLDLYMKSQQQIRDLRAEVDRLKAAAKAAEAKEDQTAGQKRQTRTLRQTKAALLEDNQRLKDNIQSLLGENLRLEKRVNELEDAFSLQAIPTDPAPAGHGRISGQIPANPKRGRKPVITEAVRERIRELRAHGCTIRTIAADTGVSRSRVAEIIAED